jgi:hypothetical protein
MILQRGVFQQNRHDADLRRKRENGFHFWKKWTFKLTLVCNCGEGRLWFHIYKLERAILFEGLAVTLTNALSPNDEMDHW